MPYGKRCVNHQHVNFIACLLGRCYACKKQIRSSSYLYCDTCSNSNHACVFCGAPAMPTTILGLGITMVLVITWMK